MGTETASVGRSRSFRYTWAAGAVGGLAGGIGMGIVLHLGANMMHLIGAIYGWPTVLGGWVAHLINSVVIGVLFAAIVSRPLFREETATVLDCVVLGTFFAGIVGIVTGGVMLPASLYLVDAQTLPEPFLPLAGAVGDGVVVFSAAVAHMVYGVLLGTVYGVVTGASDSRREFLERTPAE